MLMFLRAQAVFTSGLIAVITPTDTFFNWLLHFSLLSVFD